MCVRFGLRSKQSRIGYDVVERLYKYFLGFWENARKKNQRMESFISQSPEMKGEQDDDTL
jgi:hypothetical protein